MKRSSFRRDRGILPLIILNPTLTFGITMRRRSLAQEHSLPPSHGRFLLHLRELLWMADLLILEAKHKLKALNEYDPIVREHADMIKAELQTMKNEQFVPLP